MNDARAHSRGRVSSRAKSSHSQECGAARPLRSRRPPRLCADDLAPRPKIATERRPRRQPRSSAAVRNSRSCRSNSPLLGPTALHILPGYRAWLRGPYINRCGAGQGGVWRSERTVGDAAFYRRISEVNSGIVKRHRRGPSRPVPFCRMPLFSAACGSWP